jgi:hypothetical protein
MNLKCLFGHKWNGCKCEKCGETRDKEHNYVAEGRYLQKCTICGKVNHMLVLTLLLGYTAGGRDYGHFPLSAENDVKEIGKELNTTGGLSLMKHVHWFFEQNVPTHARHLSRLWNGIGNWKFTE